MAGERLGQQQVSPYGEMAARVGVAALDAEAWLSVDPNWHGGKKPRWEESDHESFHRTMDCIYWIREAGASRLIEGTIQGRFGPRHEHDRLVANLGNVHRSLPFDDGERGWLLHGLYARPGSVEHFKTIHQISCSAGHVESSGRMRTVPGKELLDRWWAWRRQTREFEGEGSVIYAQHSLQTIGEILVPSVVKERGGTTT